MNVSDVIHGRMVTADLRRADGERFPDGLVLKSEVFLTNGQGGEFSLRAGAETWRVEGADPRDRDTLRQMSIRPLPRLAWLVQTVPAGSQAGRVLVRVHEFPTSFVWDESVDIGVDDRIVEDLRKRQRRQVSVEDAVQWLANRMLLPPRESDEPPRARALLSGSPVQGAGKKTAFRLYGAGFAVDVERGSDDRLRATRVVGRPRAVEGSERRPIYLATGRIGFCDVTLAGQFRSAARTELDTLVAQSDSYLGLWQTYNDKEREAILRRARQFRWVRYSCRRQLPDGIWRFRIDAKAGKEDDLRERLDALDGESFEADKEVPSAIRGVDSEGPSRDPRRRPFTGELAGRPASVPGLDLRPPPVFVAARVSSSPAPSSR